MGRRLRSMIRSGRRMGRKRARDRELRRTWLERAVMRLEMRQGPTLVDETNEAFPMLRLVGDRIEGFFDVVKPPCVTAHDYVFIGDSEGT